MSIHLLECAAAGKYTRGLEPSWKLALMAFADSADKHTHIAFPGEAQVRAWSGLSRSRTYEVVGELERLGLLKKHRAGGNGRRAEYIVFPRGCCEHHPRAVDDDESGSDAPDTTPGGASEPAGSDVSDPAHGPGSDAPDPDHGLESGSDAPDPVSATGSDQGPTHRTPTPATAGVQEVTRVADPDARATPPTRQPTGQAPPARPADRDEHGPLTPFCAQHPLGTTDPCSRCASRREAFERAERRRAGARRAADQAAAVQAARRTAAHRLPDAEQADRAGRARALLRKAAEQREKAGVAL